MQPSMFLCLSVCIAVMCLSEGGYVYKISDSGGLGRRFDGIGAISGGGATSKLLVNYPQPQRDEVFDYLFKPNFGANLHILKVEIGGDMQSTDGSEATHMRTPDEENYQRGYEWWFMKEAKKRNPDLKLIGLPWGWPGWVGGDSGDVFEDPERTAVYVVKWILGAKSQHGLTIDYIGVWNESRYTPKYIKMIDNYIAYSRPCQKIVKVLRQILNKNGLTNIKIIAPDMWKWDIISSQVITDPDLADALYAIGMHYPNTNSSLLALDTGKPLWASEDHSDELFLRWNLNYVDGFMSATVLWPALSAYYKGLPYEGTGLMNASEPWTGHYDVPVNIFLAAHNTQFTKPGWMFLQHGSGVGRFSRGAAMVSLVSPDGKDLTIVIDTMVSNITSSNPAENVTLALQGSFASLSSLNVWFSQIYPYNLPASTVFENLKPMQVVDGQINLQLDRNQVWTLTTLTTGHKGSHPQPPPSKPFPLPYREDFDNYDEHVEPFLISPQTGAYEATTVEGTHGKVMRQMTWRKPVPWIWCPLEDLGLSFALIGEYYWSDISVTVDAYINETFPYKSDGVMIAARVTGGGCHNNNETGIYFHVFLEDKTYILYGDLARKNILSTNKVASINNGWNTISLSVKGSTATGNIDGLQIFSVDIPPTIQQGFVSVGTSSYGAADFDNLIISKV